MSGTIANINGSNVKRLTIEQFGSNLGAAVLQRDLLSDTAKYDVTIESLFVSADIPIFPANTHVFDIIDVSIAFLGEAVADAPKLSCVIGPVYNWLDFSYQIQAFLDKSDTETVDLEGAMIPQKNLSFVASTFWDKYVIYFTDQFAQIFENQTIWARSDTVNTNTGYKIIEDGEWTALIEADYTGERTVIQSGSRMDLFENRHRIRIDSVLSIPHELFAVGRKNQNAQVSNRYTFMEFDFPKETLYTKFSIENGAISDNQSLSQILRTGIFRLIKPNLHSGLKKMLPGQSQDHRYELFLIRKRVQADGSVKLVEEPLPMSEGDYFHMVLLFTQEV